MAAGDITIIKWEDADFKWDSAPPSKTYKPGFKPSSFPYTWDDVALIEELVEATGGGMIVEPVVDALEKEKKKKLIRLIMKRKGIKVYDESKEVKNINIHIDDIKTIIEEAKVKMQVENITC
jgi:hypothetical protein